MKNVLSSVRQKIERKGLLILRLSVGLVFFWFGFLKFFGAQSPAEDLAARTISTITFGVLQHDVSIPLLAVLECIIGLGILSKYGMRYVIPVMYFQMAGTLMPLLIFRAETWQIFPIVPTLLGQYIIKNAVLVAAGIVLGAASGGGKLIVHPEIAQRAKNLEDKLE